MKKLLFGLILFLGLNFSAYSIDANPSDIVEMYSDEMPKSSLVFKGKIPNSCYWEDEKYLGPSGHKISLLLKKSLELEGFSEFRLDPTYWNDNTNSRNNFCFGKTNKEDFLYSNFILFHINKGDVSSNPVLQKLTCKVHDSVLDINKWDCPRKVSYWTGKYANVNEMSWKYVDLLLHSEPNLSYKTEYFLSSFLEENLYKFIKIQSLQRSITRAVFTFDKKDIYRWDILYDTDEEKERGEKLILNYIVKPFSIIPQETNNNQ